MAGSRDKVECDRSLEVKQKLQVTVDSRNFCLPKNEYDDDVGSVRGRLTLFLLGG